MGTLYVAHYMWGGALPLLFDRFWVLWAFRDFTDFWDFTDFTIAFFLIHYAFASAFCLCSFFFCFVYRGDV